MWVESWIFFSSCKNFYLGNVNLAQNCKTQYLWNPKLLQVTKIRFCKMCLINVFKNVFKEAIIVFFFVFFFICFPWVLRNFSQLLFPTIVTLLSFFSNSSNHSVFDVALVAYHSGTSLTKDSVAEVEKLHIKSIKDIKSIIVNTNMCLTGVWNPTFL